MNVSPTLSVQLYSGRLFPPKEKQVAIVAKAGFTEIETFPPFYGDINNTEKMLTRHGILARSGHFTLDFAETHPARMVEIAKTLGMEFVVIPYLSPQFRPNSRTEWMDIGRRLQNISDMLGNENLKFAWHNHDFEFYALEDGSIPLEHILGENLLWEADVAWIVRSGADPFAWLNRYRGRVPLIHVKDIAFPGQNAAEDGWADVGKGILPWRDLWQRCLEAGAEVMVAEHDLPSDFDRFVQNSATLMQELVKESKT